MIGNYYASLGLHEPWAIAPDYAQSYLPILAQLLNGTKIEVNEAENSENRLKSKSYFISPNADNLNEEDFTTPQNEAPAGAIAVLNINGPIMKSSQFCGPRGTLELANELKAIYANPNFTGAILKVESGGGQAYAVKYLTDVIAERNKPVLVLAGNYLCSAAYYIASYADEIVADHPRSVIGCIGVMTNMVNTQPALEKMGVEFHEVYATQSTLKNKTSIDAMNGDYTKMRSDILDPLANDFIYDVKAQRPNISSNKTIFQGETFMAVVAKELGMIDHLGDMDFAVSRIKTLAVDFKNPNNLNTDMKFSKLEALAGVVAPTDEQLEQANAELTQAGVTNATIVAESMITEASAITAERDALTAEKATLTDSLATANTAKTTAEASLATATADLATANASIAELTAKIAKGPGATHQPAGGGKDETIETDEEKAIQAQLDALPHNQAADKYFG